MKIVTEKQIEIKINDKWINLQDYHDSVTTCPDWTKEVMNLVEVRCQ